MAVPVPVSDDQHIATCEACRTFPCFKGRVFWDPLLETPLHGWRWMDILHVWDNGRCEICKLVKHAMCSHYGLCYMEERVKTVRSEARYVSIRVYRQDTDASRSMLEVSSRQREGYYLELAVQEQNAEHGRPVLQLDRAQTETEDEYNQGWVLPKIQAIVGDESRDFVPFLGRAVDHRHIDWQYVRQWLQACAFKHPATPAKNKPVRDFIMLALDVEQESIVSLSQGQEYLALSYQWGGDQPVKLLTSNSQALKQAGSLASGTLMPSQTIVDAMKATRQLGHRYLWVDALCITQNDAESIQANVAHMDQIYTDAALTIVAACGKDAHHGLPGISRPREQIQAQAKRGKIALANMLDSETDAINFTRWNSRGWTYQERLLSERLLIFTNSQVYYRCEQDCEAREDVHMAHVHDRSAVLSIYDDRYHLAFKYRNLLEVYATAVAEYTKRSISDPSDKIKAFKGVISRLTGPFHGEFLFGLPTSLFDVGLLWCAADVSKRNYTFPSWSWAGWEGPVRYAFRDSMANLAVTNISMMQVETAKGERLCNDLSNTTALDEKTVYHDNAYDRHFDEDSLEIIYRTQTDLNHEMTYPRPMAGISKYAGLQLDDKRYHALTITATTAVFTLTGEHGGTYEPFSTCRQGLHRLCNLAVFDAAGKLAGIVYVDNAMVADLSNTKQRFMAVSRSTESRVDTDRAWDDEQKTFRLWTHQSSRALPYLTDSDAEDETPQRTFNVPFDFSVYNKNIFWPIINVLLLSPRDVTQRVERLGIGKIHVDAFLPIAKKERIFLQ